MKEPIQRRPMTDEERMVFDAIRGDVTFPVASWDKRFFRQLRWDAISEKESAQLWRLAIRYRRQWQHGKKPMLLSMAERLAAPDFRKLEKSRREQSEIDELKAKYEQAFKQS